MQNGGFQHLVHVLETRAAKTGEGISTSTRSQGKASELRTKSVYSLCRCIRVMSLAAAVGIVHATNNASDEEGPITSSAAAVLTRVLELPSPKFAGQEEQDDPKEGAEYGASSSPSNETSEESGDAGGAAGSGGTGEIPLGPVLGPMLPPTAGGDTVGAGVPMGPALPASIPASVSTGSQP